ncbi:PTS system glucose subfamily transporter subunit IIA [Fictibacillus macauensis ZFHKF-1]|uniref:PTS system glucose subfamily transporter subunit IIA n=1 Tax=Fictibacillus macauensis ZFHKF-1 TaxID=1196324 RepID=I8UD40_9BACL|nr:PTS glucose transporter subunit IIA [Fictibacillus macauensis]EIT84723.1 PTS system glucose subfamily transporter subunit IIA [Fictibacillus macauensis ZFHKF-1]
MFRKLFQRSSNNVPSEEVITSPITGKVMAIEEVPDPVFSQKMLGDGVAILPAEGNVYAPIDGEVIQVFPTKHGIGLRGRQGIELLIHVGLDTVMMKGEGFNAHVEEGERVSAGQLLLSCNLSLIEERAKSTITTLTITNGEKVGLMDKYLNHQAVANETVILRLKEIKD